MSLLLNPLSTILLVKWCTYTHVLIRDFHTQTGCRKRGIILTNEFSNEMKLPQSILAQKNQNLKKIFEDVNWKKLKKTLPKFL